MGKKLLNTARKTGTHLDTGARTLVNIPIWILEHVVLLIIALINILQKILIPGGIIFYFVDVYFESSVGGRTRFELFDFLGFVKSMFLYWIESDQLIKLIIYSVLIFGLIYLALWYVKKRLIEGAWYSLSHVRRSNNEQIERNNEKLKRFDVDSKFGSKEAAVKDNVKDFKKSSNYVKR